MATSNVTAVPSSVDDITQAWVQHVFNSTDPGVNITKVDIEGPIGQGQGYMNDLVAIVATGNKNGEEQRYNLIVKLTNFRILEFIEYMSEEDFIVVDTVEAKFYSVAVPDFLSLLVDPRESAEIKVPVAKFYFNAIDQTTKKSVRVLENLKTQGFSIKPYPHVLSLQEMLLSVGALARIHGLSHRLELESGTPLPDRYDWLLDLHTTKQDWYRKSYRDGVDLFKEAFPDHTDLLACLREVDGIATVLEVMKNPARTKVLVHADCWNNNIMFKYDEGKAVDVKLVDWQTASYRPPTFDLVVLFMLQSWDIFHNQRDAILEHYHKELQNTLGEKKAGGLQSYTLDQLKADFRADCKVGVFERMIFAGGLLPRQQPDLLRIVQDLKDSGVL